MYLKWNKENYHPSPALRAFQIFLLILIVIGIILLLTQKLWLPVLINYILQSEGIPVVSMAIIG